ncbi:MAG TPA: helix-hairpin-helix domain-containing protein [Thermoanaerobaculia bacterium]
MARHLRVQPEIVNLNTAGVEDLARIPGVDQALAEMIIRYREENGPFLSWNELRNVPGFEDEDLLEVLRREAEIQP